MANIQTQQQQQPSLPSQIQQSNNPTSGNNPHGNASAVGPPKIGWESDQM